MIGIYYDLQTFFSSRRIELTLYCEWIRRWQKVSVRDEIAEITHVKLECRNLPSAVQSHIIQSLCDSIFEHSSDNSKSIDLLKPSIHIFIKIGWQFGTSFIKTFRTKQQRNLQTFGIVVGKLKSFGVVEKLHSNISIDVCNVITANESLMIEVIDKKRYIMSIYVVIKILFDTGLPCLPIYHFCENEELVFSKLRRVKLNMEHVW